MKTGVWPDEAGVRPMSGWLAELGEDGAEPPGDGDAEPGGDSRPAPGAFAASRHGTALGARGRTGAGAPVEAIAPAEARARAQARARVRASAQAAASARAEVGARTEDVARAGARAPDPGRAVIGDQLQMPVARCEMGSCSSWHGDPAALGEADIRARAIGAGWRADALGQLACPRCQQSAPGFRATGPVAPGNPPAAITRAAPATAPLGQIAPIPATWPVAIAPAARPGQDSTATTPPPRLWPPAGRHAQRQPAPSVPAPAADRGLAGGAGWRWLMLAAQTAGLAGGNGWASPEPAIGAGRLPRIATRTPHQGAESVRAAREFTLATLRRWGAAKRGEDIATVVCELLTNVLRHALPAPGDAQRSIRFGLLQSGRGVLCAVTDPHTATPVPQTPDPPAESGYGLHIISVLSDRWGCTIVGDTGKVVWAAFTHS
jgi:anti-sigma regulatory factor (Ser/Thr protein kinase)